MTQRNDLSRCLGRFDQESTVVVVVEMSQDAWLVAGILPGVERQPLKKLKPDAEALLTLLVRWRAEAQAAGHEITRIAVAYEAGRDGFWLARWLRSREIEAHVIHATSIPVSREQRRAKSDRLDTMLLKRSFLGWLRGETGHCKMVAIPTIEEEDGRRPGRERQGLIKEQTRIVNRMKATLARFGIRDFRPDLRDAPTRLAELQTPEGVGLPAHSLVELQRGMARLAFVRAQIREIEKSRLAELKTAPEERPQAMTLQLARVMGVGIETADLLVQEVFCRELRDDRAVARFVGLTGAPDESGKRRREQGLTKAGNPRVRSSMIQLAWRFLWFQQDCALVQWFRARTADGRRTTRKVMIVALARKLLIALWRMVHTGEIPQGLVLQPAS